MSTSRLALVLVAACGGGDHGPADAPGPCWPGPGTPGGQVEAGTGDTFQPMPATLMIQHGAAQSDFYLTINARMQGLPPGDPTDPLAAGNPKTKLTIDVDGLGYQLPFGVTCPGSIGYAPSTSQPGTFELGMSLHAGFGFGNDAKALASDGHQATITIEVLGANGVYAKDTKTVTLIAPSTGGTTDAGVDAM